MRSRLLRRLSAGPTIRILCFLFVAWNAFDVFSVYYAQMRQPQDNVGRMTQKEKIFIASLHWNNEAILRTHWIPAVVKLTEDLGSSNVYVSVQESGSWDDSKGALRLLDGLLEDAGVRRNIILDETTHRDEIRKTPTPTGWLGTPRGRIELRRIPYLANLRNIVLKPLHELAKNGEHFDKVLFLNDVAFSTEDVLRLLDTRGGHYAAACALDFSKPPLFYDTFALRDSEGHEPVMQTWPYFRSRSSRIAMKASIPVPVKSCWNGITVMDAAPFYDPAKPLAFRGIPDSLAELHLEASECCLVHADNPLSSEKGVWLNPNVRVGYNGPAYETVRPKEGSSWISVSRVFFGSWENRLKRWLTTIFFKEFAVSRIMSSWEAKALGNVEPGIACLISEMQVLVENGWAHV